MAKKKLLELTRKEVESLSPSEQRQWFTELKASPEYQNAIKAVDEYRAKWDHRIEAVGSGDDSIERFYIELFHETGLNYDRLNNMAEEEVLAIADAVIRRRGCATVPLESQQAATSEPVPVDSDDLDFLAAGIEMNAHHELRDSNTIFRSAFPNGEGTCPPELRRRLRKLGLLETHPGRGSMVTPKGVSVVKTQRRGSP